MALVPMTSVQLALGAGWFALGAANALLLWWTDVTPAYGWWFAIAVGIGLAAATALASVRALRGALARATPAAGIPIGAPADAIGRAVGPVALVMAILLVLALVPGAEGLQGLAAVLFGIVGASYGPMALWVRRFEEMQGVIVAQPLNRWGVRTGPVQALRLPR